MQEGSSQRSGLVAAAWGLLQRELETLRIDCGAHAAYLLNAAGQLLLEAGAKHGVQPSVLGMLVAGGLATAQEIANLLEEPAVSSLHFYRGQTYEVYASALDQDHLLCLIVAKAGPHSQIGVVWLSIKRAGQRMRYLLGLLDRAQVPDPRLPTGELRQALLEMWDEPTQPAPPAHPASPPRISHAPAAAAEVPLTAPQGQEEADRGAEHSDNHEAPDRGGLHTSYHEALELGLPGVRGQKGGQEDE